MNQSKRFAILLEHAEPSGVVGRGRRFVDTGFPLVFNDLGDFVENTTRNRTLLKDPGDVRDMGDLDRSEVFRVEGTSLAIDPGEGGIVVAQNPLSELDLLGVEQIISNRHLVVTFLGHPTSRDEVWRVGRKR